MTGRAGDASYLLSSFVGRDTCGVAAGQRTLSKLSSVDLGLCVVRVVRLGHRPLALTLVVGRHAYRTSCEYVSHMLRRTCDACLDRLRTMCQYRSGDSFLRRCPFWADRRLASRLVLFVCLPKSIVNVKHRMSFSLTLLT